MKAIAIGLVLSATLVVAMVVFADAGRGPRPEPVAPAVSGDVEVDGLRLSSEDPEVSLGDRLFFDTRFSQYFFEHCRGDVNAPLPSGDPVVSDVTFAKGTAMVSPFRGQSMNCRQCHLGSDFIGNQPLAGRTYCDFSRRSPIPSRGGDHAVTTRNSPSMVNLGLPQDVPTLLHFDGEFASPEDLTIDTLTGRNFGWLPSETEMAVAHVARVIREDNGVNPRYVVYSNGKGIPYRALLLGKAADIPNELRIPQSYRLDVASASNQQILGAIGKLTHAYMDSIRFGTHNTFRPAGSPYDLFLEKNKLPSGPDNAEPARSYAQRLLTLVGQRKSWRWITPKDGEFHLHTQSYRFGASELQGLKVFLAEGGAGRQSHVGNCVACHTPPAFTDHRFHNNGVSQAEYDGVFGSGAFAALEIPDLTVRNAQFDSYLPASSKHPRASGRFRSAPAADKPGFADLGAWNVFANPDMPKPQTALSKIVCEQLLSTTTSCPPSTLLPLTIAHFKTASIRDLGQSAPYFHSGAMDTIEDAIRHYVSISNLARAGNLRNGSPELAMIRLAPSDVEALSAFLRSLNEDYR